MLAFAGSHRNVSACLNCNETCQVPAMIAFDDGLILADRHRRVTFCREKRFREKSCGGFRTEQHVGRLPAVGQQQFLDGAGASRMRKPSPRSGLGPEFDP